MESNPDYSSLYVQARNKQEKAEALAKLGFVSPADIHGLSIEKACFTVPAGTPHERVMQVQDKYQLKLGKYLEHNRLIVKHMGDVERDLAPNTAPPDRVAYCVRALVTREGPVEMKFDVPDEAVPELQAIGMKLTE